ASASTVNDHGTNQYHFVVLLDAWTAVGSSVVLKIAPWDLLLPSFILNIVTPAHPCARDIPFILNIKKASIFR
ncbi:MAG: hypothetical protein ACI9KM_002556, partial [Rubritalea sp.]